MLCKCSMTDIKATRLTGSLDSDGNLILSTDESSQAEVIELTVNTSSTDSSIQYRPSDLTGTRRGWTSDTGWTWFSVKQNYAAEMGGRYNTNSSNSATVVSPFNKTNLGDMDLTRLYSGKTIMTVTDQPVGTLTVSKAFNGWDSDYPDETFSFTLTGENGTPMLTGNGASLTVNGTGTDVNAQFLFRVGVSEITGEYSGVTFQNGSAVVGLKAGESITISGLPAGASYAVTELNSGDYTVSASTPKAACPPTASPS